MFLLRIIRRFLERLLAIWRTGSSFINKRWQRFWHFIKPYTKRLWLPLSIIVLSLASQVVLAWRPTAGAYVTVCSAAGLLGLAAWQPKVRKLAIIAAITPVVLMLTLSLPQSSTYYQTVILYESILLLGLTYRFMFGLDIPPVLSSIGWKGYAVAGAGMIVLGEILGIIGYGLLRHHYTFGGTSLPLVAASSVVFALTEETYFRGLIQQQARQVMHPVVAGILSTVLFASLTLGHVTIWSPVFALILGSVLAYVYHKKQNLLLTGTINILAKLTFIGLLATFTLRR